MSANLFYFFQVNDVIDTAPEFNRSLFAAGINLGDKVDNFVTNFVVSIKLNFTLRTEVTYHRNTNKENFFGHESKPNSAISIYFLLGCNLGNQH